MNRKSFIQSLLAAITAPFIAARAAGTEFDSKEAIEKLRAGKFISAVGFPHIVFFFYSQTDWINPNSNTVPADKAAPKGQFLSFVENGEPVMPHGVKSKMYLFDPALNLRYQIVETNEAARTKAQEIHAYLNRPYRSRPEPKATYTFTGNGEQAVILPSSELFAGKQITIIKSKA